MVTFYQTSDSGELVEVDFSNLENFALKEEYHADSLSKDTLNFDELLEKGIYVYSDFENAENKEGKWPEALTDGYILILVEDDSKAQRGITQILLDSINGSYYRRGILTESENVFEDWHSLDSDTNFTTNLSLGKGSPATTDGIWTEVSNLSYNIQLWKQVNTISTMVDTGGRTTNVVLNDIATLALSGAQTIYVRDSTGAFSKICLDISNGGTGATTAAGALSALGAASQTDLNSLRDSVDYNRQYALTRYPFVIENCNDAEKWTIRDIFTSTTINYPTDWGEGYWGLLFTFAFNNDPSYLIQYASLINSTQLWARIRNSATFGNWKLIM